MVRQETEFNDRINIAIDGPAGAGKSTVARLVANELSYIYVDTGAMYRAVTWFMTKLGVEPECQDEVLRHTLNMVLELRPGSEGQKVFVDGEDVTSYIRSTQVNSMVSRYAQIEGLRTHLVHLQRQMALRKGVVMDGRDIGTTVLPDAEVKVFLTASVKERALRRFSELSDADDMSLEQLEKDIAKRDALDEQREISPLRCAEDATVLDTTNMNIQQVVTTIVSFCKSQRDGEKIR
ncbi:(d)CMP kinase [Paenibacillus macquariensis]|uniref:Cytidylate kinase n=1 Tax=Paenibacillus macquariensis TaxID=948756 RepID=A0ABY1JJS5_9BACL|nr:(d)CMP kinase [Paenibacillus macquariensis]MEC0089787.1 (d)CMP kinase [Paenibacillus macquariensis]OAB30743.1 cytidylate kinase [Paenibacillus macquariensis subsp. macquariensis]SIQ31184.1 cytidylate kinase [Paenibacillus macquariensis]